MPSTILDLDAAAAILSSWVEVQEDGGAIGSSKRNQLSDILSLVGDVDAVDVGVDDSLFLILSGADAQTVFDNLDSFLGSDLGLPAVLAIDNEANGMEIVELGGINNSIEDLLIQGKYNTALYIGDGPDGIFGCEFHSDQFAIEAPAGLIVGDLGPSDLGLIWDYSTNQLSLIAGSAGVSMDSNNLTLLSTTIVEINNGTQARGSVSGESGTTAYSCGGTINTQIGPVGNVGTGDDTLFTYIIQANTLNSGNKGLILSCSGTFANTINSKRIRVKFGGTTIFDSGALAITAAADWSIYCEVIRTGAATQKCITRLSTSSSVLVATVDYNTCAATLSNNNALAVTGEATANDDIVGEIFNITFKP